MDDSEAGYTTDSTSSYFVTGLVTKITTDDLGDREPDTFSCQTKVQDSDTFGVQAHEIKTIDPTGEFINQRDCEQCINAVKPFCHVKLDSLEKLKDSTRKLLSMLEEIQGSADPYQYQTSSSLQNQLSGVYNSSFIDINGKTINKPDDQLKSLDAVDCEAEADDCSVYKRLTRKCHCLNQFEYNDFIIHFNESTKYFTSTMGEIIKNLRIVKKFIFIGGNYTKHALMFLNEGLTYSSHMEKLDIIQGCAHADVCNVFDDNSIVVVCISWPCNDRVHGDVTTQSLAATFLNKLAQLEEGRRYLKFSSKITNDLKKVVRNKCSKLEYDTLESINDTLNLMQPPLTQHSNVSYYCKPAKEGFGSKTVSTLLQYRAYMTLEEVIVHLDMLHNLSNNESGKSELTTLLPTLLDLFKRMLMEYDDSEMNIVLTKIINNVVTRKMIKPRDPARTVVVMAETATEPIIMKSQTNQIPVKKPDNKVKNKSKLRVPSPNRFRQRSKLKSSGWEPSIKKFAKAQGPNIYPVIIVPVTD